MLRFLALPLLFCSALGPTVVFADLPLSPPPSGKKYVSVSNTVHFANELSDYVVVLAHGVGPGRPRYTYEKLETTSKQPISMPQGGRYHYVSLIAVPSAEAERFASDDALFAALEKLGDGGVKGLQHLGFGDKATVDRNFPGESLSKTFTITGIDPKQGFITKVTGGEDDPMYRRSPGAKEGGSLFRLRTLFAGLALSGAAFAAVWMTRARATKS